LHGRLRDGLVRERDQRVASRPVLAALEEEEEEDIL